VNTPGDPFAFDGDGLCDTINVHDNPQTGHGWTFNSNGAGSTTPCGTSTAGYGPQGVTFTGINSTKNQGTVNFSGGIGNASSAYFTLEGPVDASLTVTVSHVPEPSSIVLFGSVLVGLSFLLRRKFSRPV